MGSGVLREQDFSLRALRDRELVYKDPFICKGGKEGCDRKCEIARIVIEGKIYPFGGRATSGITSGWNAKSTRIN